MFSQGYGTRQPFQDGPDRTYDLIICFCDSAWDGWGTWIRTKIDGVRVRCSTVELSPNARAAIQSQRRGAVNSEAGVMAQARSRLKTYDPLGFVSPDDG